MSLEDRRRTADAYDAWVDGHNHRRLARCLSVSRSQIYAWQSGQHPPPAWALAGTYEAIPDAGALGRVLDLPRLGLTLAELPSVRSADDVRDAALRVGHGAGELQGLVTRAFADGALEAHEREQLERAAEALERRAAEFRLAARGRVETFARAPRGCLRASGERPRQEESAAKVAR